MLLQIVITLIPLIISTESLSKGSRCSDKTGEEWFCPGKNFPSHFTRCCWYNTTECCPEVIEVYQAENRTVTIVGMCVISSCILIAISIAVCCFWSPCPLSNMCSVNYTYGNIIAQTKEDSLDIPTENCDGSRNYTPIHVKMKPVEDV
ncbi:uncharacterized protein LOC111064493 [Nilaparvata lugens]|uniref:uncharacterized protein LOC111064493 n=1 Tax=Nilaparvata lugens TaxID=108931 RepID=UPI000B98FB88|nr:uncharacterized protein LOC111064493 [Nilaparvata lugens]XP_039298279.1 uncharacterized protein LOC111064493 [Nilaparvata lugens]